MLGQWNELDTSKDKSVSAEVRRSFNVSVLVELSQHSAVVQRACSTAGFVCCCVLWSHFCVSLALPLTALTSSLLLQNPQTLALECSQSSDVVPVCAGMEQVLHSAQRKGRRITVSKGPSALLLQHHLTVLHHCAASLCCLTAHNVMARCRQTHK